jgi:hypothetical protein
MLAQQLDESLNLVAYHVRVLEKYDCIKLVDTKQRRGATEHFYRATRRQLLTDEQWASMPASLRPGMASAVLKSIFEDIEIASKAGTLEEVDDVHISRTPMVLDTQGWSDVAELLNESLDRILEIQAEATQRLGESNAEGTLSRVHLLHFKSPSSAELKRVESADEAETAS